MSGKESLPKNKLILIKGGKKLCPSCKEFSLVDITHIEISPINKKKKYSCENCGAMFREK